ncbi:MAG: ABC transporter permease [Ignisphaera sp.]
MRRSVVLAYVLKELKIMFSDKVTVFWLVAWPLIWVFMTAYVFVSPTAQSPVQLELGVVNYDTTPQHNLSFISGDFIRILKEAEFNGTKIFNVRVYSSEEKLREDLRKGRIDAGIVIPANFSLSLVMGSARLSVLIGARDPYSSSISYSVISSFLNEFGRRISLYKVETALGYIGQYSFANAYTPININFTDYVKSFMYGLAVPINVSYENVKPEALATRPNTLGWYTIGAVGMMFLYSGFSYGASALLSEKERGTLRRLRASPIKESELVLAIILSGIAPLVISAVIVIVVGVLTGANIVFNPGNPLHWLVPLLILDGAFLSIGLGILLSLLAKTSQGASALGTALGLMFSFTAGIWFPASMMPSWLQILSKVFSPTWIFDAMRAIMVFNRGLDEVAPTLINVALSTVAVILADIAVYKLRLKKYIEEA